MSLSTPNLRPQRRLTALPAILLAVIGLALLVAAAYAYLQSTRTEQVVVFTRPLVYGQQILPDDVTTIEVSYHRPAQLAGLPDPALVVGRWASGDIRPNDLAQPAMLMTAPPDAPTYPSGKRLTRNMVVLPYATLALGPISDRGDTVVNLGYLDRSGNPQRCQAQGGVAAPAPTAPDADGTPAPYACRLVSGARVLFVDGVQQVAYLEVSPYVSSTIWALKGDDEVELYAEAYGAASEPLPAISRVDAGTPDAQLLTAPATDTLKLLPGVPPGRTVIGGGR